MRYFILIITLTILSYTLALSMVDKKILNWFLSGVDIFIPQKSFVDSTTNSCEFKGRKIYPIAFHTTLNFILPLIHS